MQKIKRPILLTPSAVLGLLIFALAVAAGKPAAAQFSDTWEFLKAVKEKDYVEMRTRLVRGANVNGKDADGFPAIVIAADGRDLRLIGFLLEQGAYVNGSTDKASETALMRASERGALDVVRFLLNRGADPDLEDRRGETALMKAARARKKDAVRILIDAGADVDQADYTGKTALAYAREARARTVERLLEDAGARY